MKLHFLDIVVLSYVSLQIVNLCYSWELVLESILHSDIERTCLYVVGCVGRCDRTEVYSDNILISDLHVESIVLELVVFEAL